jgi:hypothetical protein
MPAMERTLLAVETRLLDLAQGANRLRFPRDRHPAEPLTAPAGEPEAGLCRPL